MTKQMERKQLEIEYWMSQVFTQGMAAGGGGQEFILHT